MQAEPENPTQAVSYSKRPLFLVISFGNIALTQVSCALVYYATMTENSLYFLHDTIPRFDRILPSQSILAWRGAQETPEKSGEATVSRRYNVIEEVKNHTKRFNFANSNSGAKISQKSREMLQTKAILTDDPDTYLMTPNNEDPKYFVISLSQDIQIETVMLINKERYTSRVQHFALFGSRQDPSESWIPLGSYEADHSNQWQAFSVAKKKWVRHLKVQIESVYDAHEYYCIITQIKVFGSSLMQGIKEDLQFISRQPQDSTNLTKPEARAQEAAGSNFEGQNGREQFLRSEEGLGVNSFCPNQVNLASLLSVEEASSTLGLSENKANYLHKFQELKLQIAERRTQLKALRSVEDGSQEEEEESVFKQLAQSLDDMKIYHYLLQQFLLVDFAEAMESKLKKVQLVQEQILRAVNESNEDEVNLVVHSVQQEAQKVQLQLVKENQSLQQQIFVFEVIVILLLVLVLVISVQNAQKKKSLVYD